MFRIPRTFSSLKIFSSLLSKNANCKSKSGRLTFQSKSSTDVLIGRIMISLLPDLQTFKLIGMLYQGVNYSNIFLDISIFLSIDLGYPWFPCQKFQKFSWITFHDLEKSCKNLRILPRIIAKILARNVKNPRNFLARKPRCQALGKNRANKNI